MRCIGFIILSVYVCTCGFGTQMLCHSAVLKDGNMGINFSVIGTPEVASVTPWLANVEKSSSATAHKATRTTVSFPTASV